MQTRCIGGNFVRALITAAALAVGMAGAANAATTIRASSWHPPKHPGVVGGYEPFMEYVRKTSNNKIDFKFWSGGSLLGASDTLPGVMNGIADIGVLALTYFPAEFPYAQLVSDMAMLSDNPPAIAAAVTEFVMLECEPCRKEYASKGLVFTASYSTTPYTLISKQNLNTPESLKGRKFRSAGTVWDRWTEFVGGTSVNVSAAEMFESLDRGGVDVAVFSPAALQSFSLWDVAKYDVMLPLGTYAAMSLFTMNRDFWRDLKPDERRILLDGAAVGAIGVTYAYIDTDKIALEKATEHGVEVVQPGQALLAQRDAFIEQDLVRLNDIARTRYKIADAAQWIERYRATLQKWEERGKEIGNDRAAWISAMQTHIYAKVDPATYGM